MTQLVPLLQLRKYLRQIQILHVYVCVLKILVEGPDAVEDADMVDGYFEEIVAEVLEEEGFGVVFSVGRDLVLLVVQFAGRRLEVFVLLFDFQSFALFFTHYQLITVPDSLLLLLSNYIVFMFQPSLFTVPAPW
jgi:hypothetical protein